MHSKQPPLQEEAIGPVCFYMSKIGEERERETEQPPDGSTGDEPIDALRLRERERERSSRA